MSPSADLVKAVLRRLSPAGAALLGFALLGLGVLVLVVTEEGALIPLLTPVCAIGLVLVSMSAFHAASATFGDRAAKVLAWALALSVAALAGFGYLSMRYNRGTHLACNDALGHSYRAPDSLELRRSALAEGERRIASWWSLAPRLFDDLPVECRWAREDLERQRQGSCPREPIAGVECLCGGRSWPGETGCVKKPSCPWDTHGRPESFNCWRD